METITKRRPKGSRHKHTLAIVIICIILGALIAAGVAVFLNRDQIFGNNSSETTNNDKKDLAESSTNKDKGNEKTTKNEVAPRETEKESVSQFEGEDPNKLEVITGNVNYVGISGGDFIIRVTLDQALGNSGTCNFTLTNTAGAVIAEASATNAGPTTSFCSYSIPAANISSGYWTISVKITGDNKEGTITGEVSI